MPSNKRLLLSDKKIENGTCIKYTMIYNRVLKVPTALTPLTTSTILAAFEPTIPHAVPMASFSTQHVPTGNQ